MEAIFRKLIEDNFSDLAGLTVEASIPVPEHIINEIIAVTLQGNKNIDNCRVYISEQNKVSINLKTSLWPWPINIKLRLERSVDLTSSPQIRASLKNNVLLGKLGSLFKALPDWVHIHDDQVVIEVRSFLATPEQRKMLDLIKSIEIRTEQAKMICDVKIEVKE